MAQLLDDSSEPGEVGVEVLRRLAADLKRDGGAPFAAMGEAADLLIRAQRAVLSGADVPWLRVYGAVRAVIAAAGLIKAAMNRAIAVCGTLLHQIECGIQISDVPRQLVGEYLDQLYLGRFESHVDVEASICPAAATMPPSVLAGRLAGLRAALRPGLAGFVNTLCEGKGVRALRAPKRRRPAVDPEADWASPA